ncbi:MAG: methyl-accepting chemotaxis protein [Phycisphaerales bacterium]|nr:methyl-accepting chemotaxis protein [Phycisphaerales bacterium]
MAQTSLLNSVSSRLIVLGVVPAVLAIAAIVAWSAVDGYRQALEAESDVLVADAVGAAAELNVRNDRWNALAQTLAHSQASGLFGRRAETVEFLRRANSVSSLNLSMYIVYEPDADGQDAASLKNPAIPADSMDAAGRFVPVVFDVYGGAMRTGESGLKPSVGMETLDYYTAPKAAYAASRSTSPILTEPYDKEGQQILSHVCPIVIDGKFAGIAGINRTLDILEQIAQAIKDRTHADVFIISSGDVFIAATTDRDQKSGVLKDRKVAETAFAQIAGTWRALGSTASTFEAVDPVLREDCVYARAEVDTGDWTVIIRRPKSAILANANASVVRNIVVGAAGILIVGGLMFTVSSGIARRVSSAAESAERIARGDLTLPVERFSSKDESGQLMRSMHTMDANLNSLVGNVKQASIRLNSTATEIAATSKQQEASSATFGAASNQIAAAVKEISATGRDLVKTMESVNRMAAETASLAGSGQTSLQSMEMVMRDLDGATVSIADKLSAINQRSQKITSVVTTITKVADQTNILSINAAIEAEKAGEYGAGFLVIAREIRRLADQTASATLDIDQMVQQMQGAVSSGVMEMDRFADQVRRGVREVASAGSQLNEIIDRVNRSTESFKQVNESMQAQSEGAQQISEAMASLVANANQTVQSIKEFARAAADLQSAIGLLREAVSQFRLRE